MLFWSVFLKMHFKKVFNHQKRSKLRFWQLTTFLCIFKNTAQKNICASIVFEAKLDTKHKEKKLFWGFLFKTQSVLFLGVKINSFKNSIFKKKTVLVFECKRKLYAKFHTKYWYLGPMIFFEMKILTHCAACALPAPMLKFRIWTS